MAVWVKSRLTPHTESADLGSGLSLAVLYEGIENLEPGVACFNVYVFGRRLKRRSPTVEDGKRRAEAFARTALAASLAAIDKEPTA